jgi:hypothetical protein
MIQKWRKAAEIREFIEQIRRLAAEAKRPLEVESGLGKQIAWAEKYADSLDPIMKYRERVLAQKAIIEGTD